MRKEAQSAFSGLSIYHDMEQKTAKSTLLQRLWKNDQPRPADLWVLSTRRLEGLADADLLNAPAPVTRKSRTHAHPTSHKVAHWHLLQ